MIFLITVNYALLNVKEHFPDFRYYQNILINIIYYLAILLDFLLFILVIWMNIFQSKRYRLSKYIILLCLFNIVLIWIEAFYASIWYYGGLGNHQGIPLDSNNLFFYGSIWFALFIVYTYIFELRENISKRIIYLFIGILFITLIHFIFYEIITLKSF